MSSLGAEPSPRGLYFKDGRTILSTPSSFQIEKLPADPRVEYFSTLGQEAQFVDNMRGYQVNGESSLFDEFVKHPLAQRIRQQFKTHPELVPEGFLYVRGTVASLDGPIAYQGNPNLDRFYDLPGVVRGIEQILRDGTDTGERETRVSPTILDWRDETFFGLAIPFLAKYAKEFRKILMVNDLPEDSIFPLLLVYPPNAKTVEGAWIRAPEDEEARARFILKAYILDYPHDLFISL